jgi:hypothetical protein
VQVRPTSLRAGGREGARTGVATASALVVLIVLAGCTGAAPGRSDITVTGPAATVVTLPGSSTAPLTATTAPTLPPDTGALSAAACASSDRAPGWLAEENARPGSPLPKGAVGTGTRTGAGIVVGYPRTTSGVCGDRVDVSLSGPAMQVQLFAYRMGAYDGVGSRQVWQSAPVTVSRRGMPAPVAEGTVEPDWPTSLQVPITAEWPPGMYLLVPQISGRAAGPAIPFVVRGDVGREPLLYMASTLTWGAYNGWGGLSLYWGPGLDRNSRYDSRARVVSLRRPLDPSGWQSAWVMDLTTVAWLETQGVDVDYTTDVGIDQRPSTVLQHTALITGGHSEYWSRRMYDTLDAAVARGVNVAFLGANNVWWQTRLEADGARMVVYRDKHEDPVFKENPSLTTMVWGQGVLGRNIATLNGESHTAIEVTGGLRLMHPPAWLVAGSTLTDGSVLPLVVGNEADGFKPNSHRPKQLQVVGLGVLDGAHGPVYASMNYVSYPSGAGVFATGSTYWPCAMINRCPGTSVPAGASAAARALTANVIKEFSRPRAGWTNPSQPWVPGPIATVRGSMPAGALGRYRG